MLSSSLKDAKVRAAVASGGHTPDRRAMGRSSLLFIAMATDAQLVYNDARPPLPAPPHFYSWRPDGGGTRPIGQSILVSNGTTINQLLAQLEAENIAICVRDFAKTGHGTPRPYDNT